MNLRQKQLQTFSFSLLGLAVLLSGCSSPIITSKTSKQSVIPNDPTPSLLEARRAKSNPSLNFLTYQHMDQLFGVQTVAPSSQPSVWPKGVGFQNANFNTKDSQGPLTFDEYLEKEKINAIVVLRDGKIVTEAYRNGSDENTRFLGMSVSKSIISLLIGIAIKDGSISSVDDEVTKYIPELKNTAYQGVTIKNLLMMRSGTNWKEIYTPGSELDNHRDLSLNQAKAYYEDYAYKVKKDIPPGTKFNYSTLDTDIAGWALERAIGRSLADYMSEKLWKPAGMESPAYWVEQGVTSAPRIFYGGGLAATVRDYARIGQLMLNNGQVENKQIVPASWVKESVTDYNRSPGYGYFWWIDRNSVNNQRSYGAYGINGQAIYVDPASRTVIAVAGYWPVATDKKMSAAQSEMFEAIKRHIR